MDSKKFFSSTSSKINIGTINSLLSSNIDLFKSRTNYELMYEAFYISNLFYKMINTKYHLKDPYFYLLNLDWFSKWKKYVNYDFYTRSKFRKKFISLNSLPFRPNDINNEENYLKYINKNTEKKLFDFFEKFFLRDNANLYPGYINNKIFMVDKTKNNTYLHNNYLENNFNIINDAKFNVNYIWITEDIWKYFHCMYGGCEIRRRNINNIFNNNSEFYLNSDINYDLNPEKNIILEPKLKTFNLIIFHYMRNYKYKIDPPKYFFVPHFMTIVELKKKIKNIFPFLSNFNLDDIHLFYLAQNMNLNTFYEYIGSNRNFKNEMDFPGINLDSFDEDLTLELFEDKYLKNNNENIITNLVLEIPFFLREKGLKIFLFKNPKFIKTKENLRIINYKKPYYDIIEINNNDNENDFVINQDLFLIKKFFYEKYFIDKMNKCEKIKLNILLKKIIDNFKDEQIKKIYEAEIITLRNNMDLIFDKNYLVDNIPNLYLNAFDNNNNNGINHNNKFIGKKRENNNKNEIIIDSNDDLSESESDNEISLYTCGFCGKALNKDCVFCRFCLRKKYCRIECRKKDIKNHLLKCGK